MTDYQEMVLMKLLVPLIILVLIASTYFFFSKNHSFSHRIFVSAHSIITLVGAAYAVIVCQYTSLGSFAPHTANFSRILAIAVVFGFICVFLYQGNKRLHLLLFPFVICLALVWHIGGQAITHTMS